MLRWHVTWKKQDAIKFIEVFLLFYEFKNTPVLPFP